ncbi:MAG: tetratricopeptide repeat protein [Flavobacteriales bacterium]|jgi:tetratricopeptide (TPR) repeat protein|nr:tetratricopeptide repeat protein [Flavobacteriales bacterium]MBT5751050.1 tetratricopeptide repeat protein [Flavobacteriales bacterium]
MIKKGLLTILVLVLFTNLISAQKHNVVNASIALRNEEYSDAKKYIDEAFDTESTSNDAKMWNYRAPIYLQIALKEPALDINAIFKATEAHLKCLQTDKKGRVIVRKWTAKEDILAGTIQCGYKLFNNAIEEYNAGNYKSSLKHYTAIFEIIPLDTEDQLKRGNITRETILYNSFFSSNKMKDNTKSKELLQKLIDINFNEPAIFVHMSNIFLEEGETDKALEYLALGREIFEEDQGLINTEINLYIQLGRTSELIGKLGEAIILDEENDLLYFNRGTIYDQEGDIDNAEKDYLTALELNPSAFGANYNLGALYFNQGVETKNKANVTSNNSLYSKLNKEADAVFAKAFPYLEMAHELNAEDKNTLLSLKQLYYLSGDYAKSEEMKKLIAELK